MHECRGHLHLNLCLVIKFIPVDWHQFEYCMGARGCLSSDHWLKVHSKVDRNVQREIISWLHNHCPTSCRYIHDFIHTLSCITCTICYSPAFTTYLSDKIYLPSYIFWKKAGVLPRHTDTDTWSGGIHSFYHMCQKTIGRRYLRVDKLPRETFT